MAEGTNSKVIRFALLLTAIFALATGVSMGIGRVQPAADQIARLHLADCAPPCWNGITPGISVSANVIDQMDASLPEFARDSSVSLPLLGWRYTDPSKANTVINVVLKQDRVVLVDIGASFAPNRMPSFAEMLAVFGSPTCVSIDNESGATSLGYEDGSHQMILQFTTYLPILSSPVESMFIGVSEMFNCQKAIPWPAFRHALPDFYETALKGLYQ